MDKIMIFLEEVREIIRKNHLSDKTEESYLDWIYRFMVYHHHVHPKEMGEEEIAAFLTFLAVEKDFSASTQNQALCALIFLYKQVLERALDDFSYKHVQEDGNHLPVVLSRKEVNQVLSHLEAEVCLMASVMYGSGLQLNECLKLRVRDVDFDLNQIIVRDEKEDVERQTLLPLKLRTPLKNQIEASRVKLQENLMRANFAGASMPKALERKFPGSSKELAWQYIFFAQKISLDPASGNLTQQQQNASFLQKAVKKAILETDITKKATCYTLRHSFATHLLEDGYAIHTVQELLGHKDARTTMQYMKVLTRNKLNVRSPLDRPVNSV